MPFYVWKRNDEHIGCSCYKPVDYDNYSKDNFHVGKTTFEQIIVCPHWEGTFGAATYLNAAKNTAYWKNHLKGEILHRLALVLILQDKKEEATLQRILDLEKIYGH